MTLTEKEKGLLKDLRGQEQLCIGKYGKYAQDAKAEELKCLFNDLKSTEEAHLRSIDSLMGGTVQQVSGSISGSNNAHCCAVQYQNESDRQNDAFLCQDMLATEKHASALYNTSVFEFSDPAARKLLNHIEAEEQQHGEKLYAYMNANNMYC